MQDEMLQLIAIAAVLAPVTTGFTEMYKQYTPANGRWLPALSLATGVAFGLLCAWTFGHVNLLLEYGLAGLLSGLSATGFYQLVKPTSNSQSSNFTPTDSTSQTMDNTVTTTTQKSKATGYVPQMRRRQGGEE